MANGQKSAAFGLHVTEAWRIHHFITMDEVGPQPPFDWLPIFFTCGYVTRPLTYPSLVQGFTVAYCIYCTVNVERTALHLPAFLDFPGSEVQVPSFRHIAVPPCRSVKARQQSHDSPHHHLAAADRSKDINIHLTSSFMSLTETVLQWYVEVKLAQVTAPANQNPVAGLLSSTVTKAHVKNHDICDIQREGSEKLVLQITE